MDINMLAMLPLWYVAFLFSLTCHEAAHALVAKWGGDLTAYHAGQVTLNPLPHIQREFWGTVIVPLISYLIGRGAMLGWGSAPFDPYWEQRYPKRAAWMALAGPAANMILVLVSAILMHIGLLTGFFQGMQYVGFTSIIEGTDLAGGVAAFLSILFSLNLMLGLFNLFPVPPLDGNTAIALILPDKLNDKFREFTRQPMLQMFGVLIAWVLIEPIFRPAWSAAVLLLVYPASLGGR
ncbi:MAG TPA: site-2 protease family protein [Bryobacteraceae bacterium]|jgi:Zn-dependent protease